MLRDDVPFILCPSSQRAAFVWRCMGAPFISSHYFPCCSSVSADLQSREITRPPLQGWTLRGSTCPLIDVKLTCASQNTSHPPSGACAFNKMRRQRKAFISMAAVCLRDGTVEKIYYVRPKQTVCCSLEVIFCCSGAGLR